MTTKFSKVLFIQGDDSANSLPMLCKTLEVEIEVRNQPGDVRASELNRPDLLLLVSQDSCGLNRNGVPVWVQRLLPEQSVALFGVTEDSVDPVHLLTQGVKGVLYHNDRVDMSLSALRALIQGELWFSRATLEQAVCQMIGAQAQQSSRQEQDKLTNREQSVVRLVALGARNKEIARKLFISEYTVKAHLASIFRKTETRNRVELVSKLGLA
ncbi:MULTISPECIES: response regulator transcription factor [Ferrimonas]|uniref:helix-turn-helix transcriptional regulator n=1 Tax=Ferrimonas TaxID=44011 RepID=UPI0004038BD1|nr:MULTISPECIES: response regulator transcription factor [Ferrimonas]USD37073.1 response regulator transcription factor [Ferrimonas sp. SCSIO 43195]